MAQIDLDKQRTLGTYFFEPSAGGDGAQNLVRIIVEGDVPTEAALEMVATLVKMKREELARAKGL